MALKDLPEKYPNVPIYLTALSAFFAIVSMAVFGFWEGLKVSASMLMAPALYWTLVAIEDYQKRKR